MALLLVAVFCARLSLGFVRLRRPRYFSLLVQREVPKRKHALRLASVAADAAPAGKRCSRARGRCRRAIHGAAATEPNFLFGSPAALAALLGARQRGVGHKQQRSDASRAKLLWLLTLGSPSLALSCAASAGESRTWKSGERTATPGWRGCNGPEHLAQRRALAPASGRRSRGVLSLAYFSLHKLKRAEATYGGASAAGAEGARNQGSIEHKTPQRAAKPGGLRRPRLTRPTVLSRSIRLLDLLFRRGMKVSRQRLGEHATIRHSVSL
ncbi:hypothetical protein SAMN04488038_12215 [Solimonas aquatica]|uniref:Uncharacterized protein n=1 Tax=Solimonas aquatica TaxID=489703 RepID=A0A1H9MEX4_9GAMM|nr:hypothetical protein SAMN04488038_12215 [Solimonas aquatica]